MTTAPTTRRRPQQDKIFQAVRDSGSAGMTWVEIGDQFGLHHGSASSALSHLQQEGMIVRLRVRRGRSSVYVAPEHATPESIAPPRATQSRIALADAYDRGWQTGYDQGVEAGRMFGVPEEDLIAKYRQEGANLERRRLFEVASSMLLTIDPQQATVTHRGGCWRTHPSCAVRAFRRGLAPAA